MSDLVNKNFGGYVKKGVYEPIGYCQRTGFPFSISDLHKQYDAFGNCIWERVGKPFLDQPNPQSLPPLVKDDPRPVQNPALRPPMVNAPIGEEAIAQLRKINFNG